MVYEDKQLLTWEDIPHPRKFTRRNFSVYVRSLIDQIDFARKKGQHRKSHDAINHYLSRPRDTWMITLLTNKAKDKEPEDGRPKNLAYWQKHRYSLQEHLEGRDPIYYTSRGDSFIHMLKFDVDQIDKARPDLPALEIVSGAFRRLLGPSYEDRGTSGTSYNYVLLVNTERLWEQYKNSLSIGFGSFCREIYKLMGRVLRPVFNCPTPFALPESLGFDGLKGTPSQYSYHDHNGRRYYTQILNSGTLAKLPCPKSQEEWERFVSMEPVDIIVLLSFCVYLGSASFFCLSQLLPSDAFSTFEKALKCLSETLDKAQSSDDDCPQPDSAQPDVPQSANTDCLEPDPTDLNPSCLNKQCIYREDFSSTEDLESIRNELNALIRSRRYLYYCFQVYAMEDGREPTFEDYRQGYRRDVGTGPEDHEDLQRLHATWNKYHEKMRKYVFGTLEQLIVMLENSITLSDAQITGIRNEVTKGYKTKKRHVTKRDIAIGALWISSTLRKPINHRHNTLSKRGKDVHFSRELTAPRNAMKAFFEQMKKKGLNKTSCDNQKARVVREILMRMGWIKIVDGTRVLASQNDGEGRSWRYILLPAHPLHRRFETHVGPARIEFWKNRGKGEQEDGVQEGLKSSQMAQNEKRVS